MRSRRSEQQFAPNTMQSASSQCLPHCSVIAINPRKTSSAVSVCLDAAFATATCIPQNGSQREQSFSCSSVQPRDISASPDSPGRRHVTWQGRSGMCRRLHITASYRRGRARAQEWSLFDLTGRRTVHRRRLCEHALAWDNAPFCPEGRRASAASRRARSIWPSAKAPGQ